ncbi:MAG: metallophosphoesterase family protein [Aggregatilineales bacterium]
MDKIAIISDIHGNMQALEAVLADIEQAGITHIYCLGDLVGKGPDGHLAVDRCREVCDVIVRGNWDDFIGRDGHDQEGTIWWKAQLGEERLAYLKNLPGTHDFWLSGKRVRLYHASHISVYHRIHAYKPFEVYQTMFQNTEFTGYDVSEPDIVGYGDIHAAYMTYVDTGKILFNAGSAGNPLDAPVPVYTVLKGVLNSEEAAAFTIEFVRVPYDAEAAIQRAKDVNMPETDAYAKELRTGIYRGRAAE